MFFSKAALRCYTAFYASTNMMHPMKQTNKAVDPPPLFLNCRVKKNRESADNWLSRTVLLSQQHSEGGGMCARACCAPCRCGCSRAAARACKLCAVLPLVCVWCCGAGGEHARELCAFACARAVQPLPCVLACVCGLSCLFSGRHQFKSHMPARPLRGSASSPRTPEYVNRANLVPIRGSRMAACARLQNVLHATLVQRVVRSAVYMRVS